MLCFPPAVTGSLLTGNYTSRLLPWPPYSSKGHGLFRKEKHTDLWSGSASKPLLWCPWAQVSELMIAHQAAWNTAMFIAQGCVFEQDPQFSLIPEQERAIFGTPVWKTGSPAQFSEMGSDSKRPLHSLNQERRNLWLFIAFPTKAVWLKWDYMSKRFSISQNDWSKMETFDLFLLISEFRKNSLRQI